MDFIIGFSKVRDFKSIFVIVDRFSKYSVFVPAPDHVLRRKRLGYFSAML